MPRYFMRFPKHTKINIPFSLARRICTIVGNKTILKQRLSELANILIKRQHPKEVIKTGLKKALEIPRHQAQRYFIQQHRDVTAMGQCVY